MCICLTPNTTQEMSAKEHPFSSCKVFLRVKERHKPLTPDRHWRKCSPDLIPLSKVHLIKVTSEQLHLVPGKVCLGGNFFHQWHLMNHNLRTVLTAPLFQALRRQCCDIVRSSSENTMDVNIRKCKDNELIMMDS
jgi:hypothetical protein